MNRTRRTAAIALTAGPLLYLAAEATTAAGWRGPAYSYLHNWISDLGVPDPGTFQGRSINSPLHDVMNTGFVIGGVALIVGLVALTRTLSTRIRRAARVLAAFTGSGYALVGLTHTSTTAAANGTLALHFLGAFLAILGGNTLAITLGIHWWRQPGTQRLGHASVPLGILGLTAATALGFTATSTTAPNGLIERIAVYTVVLWQLRTAIHLATTTTNLECDDQNPRLKSTHSDPVSAGRTFRPDSGQVTNGRPERVPETSSSGRKCDVGTYVLLGEVADGGVLGKRQTSFTRSGRVGACVVSSGCMVSGC